MDTPVISPREHPPTGAAFSPRNILRLAAVQGLYELIGGAWPLINMDSFESVTGPKRDEWLVRTVAGMLVVLGGALMHGTWHGRIDRSLRIMAGGIALVLGMVALVSSIAGWISWKYVIDGIIQLAFFTAWLVFGWRKKPMPPAAGSKSNEEALTHATEERR